MTSTNATNFRNNVFEYLNQAVLHNDVIMVSTKNGNAVVLSEEDYSGLMETLYLMRSAKTYEEILDGMKEPPEEGVAYNPEDPW